MTIVFETSGGHFVEFMKIAKQTSTDSYWQIARKVTATKGLAGTLDGFFPWGAMQAVAKGSVFSFGQAWSMGIMHGWTSVSKDTKTVVSGGAGGFIQGLAMSPLLLLKTRVMTDPVFRTSGGIVATAIASARVGGRIVANEGPATLFKGVGVFSLKRALDWSTRYLFVVMVEEALKARNVGLERQVKSLTGQLKDAEARCRALERERDAFAEIVRARTPNRTPPPELAGGGGSPARRALTASSLLGGGAGPTGLDRLRPLYGSSDFFSLELEAFEQKKAGRTAGGLGLGRSLVLPAARGVNANNGPVNR